MKNVLLVMSLILAGSSALATESSLSIGNYVAEDISVAVPFVKIGEIKAYGKTEIGIPLVVIKEEVGNYPQVSAYNVADSFLEEGTPALQGTTIISNYGVLKNGKTHNFTVGIKTAQNSAPVLVFREIVDGNQSIKEIGLRKVSEAEFFSSLKKYLQQEGAYNMHVGSDWANSLLDQKLTWCLNEYAVPQLLKNNCESEIGISCSTYTKLLQGANACANPDSSLDNRTGLPKKSE